MHPTVQPSAQQHAATSTVLDDQHSEDTDTDATDSTSNASFRMHLSTPEPASPLDDTSSDSDDSLTHIERTNLECLPLMAMAAARQRFMRRVIQD
jgi:hypothetical protein